MFGSQAWAGSTTVVISQIYGAGGNSGAVLDSDFVELFNLSSQPVSLNGWSIQYVSSGGTAATSGTAYSLPNVTLQPGQHFIMKGATGTTCTASSTPACPTFTADGTSAINLSGTIGKVFLVNTTTLLTGVTPTGTSGASSCTGPTSVVDYVGFGNSATCAEGGKYTTPNATATQAIIRTNPCVDTDNNAADFSNGTPVPHNMSSTFTPCSTSSSPTAPTLTASVTPASQTSGLSVLLTGAGTPGSSPASTGLAVTADLSALGGSATQPLNDAGTNGDVTAGDGTYSYSFTIPSGQAANLYKLPFTVSDSQLRSSTTSANLTVTAPVSYTPIHTIQGSMGNGMTAPTASSYVGQVVQTSGIVTGVLYNGFYLQSRDNATDSDPTTPEGLFVYTGSASTSTTPVPALGSEVQVTGTATLYPSGATLAGLELKGITGYSVLSTGNPLPAPITLTTSMPSPNGGPYQLLRYQSMRVTVPSFTATEGTQGTLTESDETYVSNGQFYGTVTGITRPVRGPGLEVLDPLTPSYPNIPQFDDNPEVIAVDSTDSGGAAIDLATGSVLTNMTGVMDFSGIEYNANSGSGPQLGAGPVFMLDAATRPTVTGGMTVVSVPAAKANELTIGDQNMERFYNATADTAGAVVLTSAAYQHRLAKASLAIRNVLGTPDILCLEEMENLATLTDLSNKISADALAAGQIDPLYVPYLTQGNDSSAINVAFLVKPSKVDVTDVTQFGKGTTYTNSTGAQAVLNDRPPLVMHAGIKRSGVADYPLTIIVNHLRSLNGVTDATSSGQSVRLKREAQAEFLASLIQGYQANGEHVISVGDYNAFEFNDGLVDTLDIVRGVATNANQDVVPGPATPIVTPALVDLAPTNVANGTYSYVYVGDAQSIDHFFATSDIASLIHTAPAHFDADFPVVYRNDAARPEASSDHDGIVGYLSVPSGTVITVAPSSLTYANSQPLNTPSASQPVTVTNTGTSAITISSIVTSTGFTQTNNCGTSLAGGANCIVNVVFQPTVTSPQTGTLTLNDSDANKMQTIALSGTGAGIYSTISLSVAPPTAVAGANVVLTATLSGNSTNLPSGNVNFSSNGTVLGTAAITSGVASLTTKSLPVGSDAITASYTGDAVYPTVSTTAPVTVTITPAPIPDFTFSISNTAINVSGSTTSGSSTMNVAMVNGFSSSVTFSCSGLPSNSHCSFAPATLTTSGSSVLTVVIDKAALAPAGVNPMERNEGIAVAMLLGLPLLLRRSLRTKLGGRGSFLAALLFALTISAITGCGSATTNKGTSTVVVTATGGNTSHTASVTLNVQ
ncbi:Ig-like domain repeat protein [Granulicella paludicola]|uniref:Ig-like domain repeat protein n=1 Tax=Granulicella paludicola TaxID=474951 RepID=UPI0021E0D08C|nr:Ig-like domain repeat protein [Granulicella paludicola]